MCGPWVPTHKEFLVSNQELLAKDVKVSNLPESKAENPAHVAIPIGRKLEVYIERREAAQRDELGGSY